MVFLMQRFSRQPEISADRLRRFEAKLAYVSETGCVIWLAGTNEHGYGVFWNGERLEKAHRFALRAAGVEVPDEADVCHSCDIPCCVAPAHLFVADAQTNVSDMWRKGRATVISRFGTAQAQAKLSDDKAARIRSMVAAGWKHADVADVFGVSKSLISRVVNGKNWFSPSGVKTVKGCAK